MTDDRPPNADEAPDEQAITAVTIEPLSARIDELMQRVQAGEVSGSYREGALEAIPQPPDPAERKMNALVQAGGLAGHSASSSCASGAAELRSCIPSPIPAR